MTSIMREMLGHLGHLTHHAFVLWYTWLGTSPGGVIAQLLVLFLTEGRGGMLRWEAWRENWQGGLEEGFLRPARSMGRCVCRLHYCGGLQETTNLY